jgi:hypothetical protein
MKFSLSIIALFGLAGFGMVYAADETADAMELAIRKSDPAALRGLLIPGFDLTAPKKAELLALAKRVTNETFMNLNRASITDGWRFLKGVAKCALAAGCGIMAYGMFMKAFRLIPSGSVTSQAFFTTSMEQNGVNYGSVEEEQLSQAQRADRYGRSLLAASSTRQSAGGSSTGGPLPTIGSQTNWPAVYREEHIANGISAGLALYLGYLGVSDIRASIGGKARYKHHQRALAVEAIIQRIPACPGPECTKNTGQQDVQTPQPVHQTFETSIDIDQVD